MPTNRYIAASLSTALSLVLVSHLAVAQPAMAQPSAKSATQKAAPMKAPPLKVKEEKAGLLAKAKVSADSAIAIARATIPGATITSAEIENEGGALIYTFDMKIAGKKGTEEVNVDAMTGKMLKREHEDAAAEKKEAADDKAKAKKGKPPV